MNLRDRLFSGGVSKHVSIFLHPWLVHTARAQKGALDINLHTDLVANPGKGEAGITHVFSKRNIWNHHQQLKGRMGLQSKLRSYIWAFISTNNGVCILTSKDGPLSQAISRISKVPNCKGCCWKTWFPGTRCYTNLGYHGFWWRKEMDKMESLAEQMRGKTHTLTVNVIFLKLTLRVDGGLIKRLPACQNGNDAWWFCSKPTNCTPQENNPTDRHWTTPNKSTSNLPKMFSAIVLYEHLRACFHF